MIISNTKNIGDIIYLNKSYSEVYKGETLVFKKNEVIETPEGYDLICQWNSRTASLADMSEPIHDSNGQYYPRLAMKLNGKRYRLDDYLEEAPSTITNVSYYELTGGDPITYLGYMFSGNDYYTYDFSFNYWSPKYANNTYLTDILYMRVPKTVTTMGYAFYSCTTLKTMNVDWDCSNVTTFSNTFSTNTTSNIIPITTVTGTIKGISADINLSKLRNLTNESVMVFMNGLAKVSSSKKITLYSNVYNTLTTEQKQIASDKGWTIASAS